MGFIGLGDIAIRSLTFMVERMIMWSVNIGELNQHKGEGRRWWPLMVE